jgi:hypothetical protein
MVHPISGQKAASLYMDRLVEQQQEFLGVVVLADKQKNAK